MSHRRVKWADLIVLPLVLALCGAGLFGSLTRSRETANRVKCASNLKQIGLALLLYANENKGTFPRTVYDAGDGNPKSVWGTPYEANKDLGPNDEVNPVKATKPELEKYCPAANDVTAALFLLMRTEDITSEVFICPSTGQQRWDFGGGANSAQSWTNWKGVEGLRGHVSYSLSNPYPSKKAIADGWRNDNYLKPDFAMAGDLNPGVDSLMKLTVGGSVEENRKCNSFNHNRDGQNVLFGDGHVEFCNTPLCGVSRDNIYSFGPSGTNEKTGANEKTGGEGIVGAAQGQNDSVLLPTARDLGMLDASGELIPPATTSPTK